MARRRARLKIGAKRIEEEEEEDREEMMMNRFFMGGTDKDA